MRFKGILTQWNSERGYGFITPCEGGSNIFVHITAFQNRSRTPKNGDTLIYQIDKARDGKIKAILVTYNGEIGRYNKEKSRSNGLGFMMIISILFLACISISGIIGIVPFNLVILYLGMSALSFLMYWQDKSAARKGYWRTKESTLLIFGLIGGWPGAVVAQQLFRHKSSKTEFQVSFWISVLMNCAVLGWLLSAAGKKYLGYFH